MISVEDNILETTTKLNKTVVVGIGGAGVNILRRLHVRPEAAGLKLVAVDTDAESLANFDIGTRIEAGFQWTSGHGCGGNVIKGQRALSVVRAQLKEQLAGASQLIVTGGFGKGTTTGGVPILASVARELSLPAMFIMTQPFAFEGPRRQRQAEDGIRELLPSADIMICLPNDLLFSCMSPDTPSADAYDKATDSVGAAIVGVAGLFSGKAMVPADFADLHEVLHRRKSSCFLGLGRASAADGLDRVHLAIERMLDSPFMGGLEHLREADCLFLVLTAGPDLTSGEMKKIFDTIAGFANEGTEIIAGADCREEMGDAIQLTAIAICYDEKEEIRDLRASSRQTIAPLSQDTDIEKTESLFDVEQGELPFVNFSKGIFANSSPNTFEGEDLDVPTFQRRMIKLDKGM
jgi:cell division protein FtsZ